MPKFSGTKRRPRRANPTAPIRTTRHRTLTHEGGAAFARDAESELFLLAATNMVADGDGVYHPALFNDRIPLRPHDWHGEWNYDITTA